MEGYQRGWLCLLLGSVCSSDAKITVFGEWISRQQDIVDNSLNLSVKGISCFIWFSLQQQLTYEFLGGIWKEESQMWF